MLKWLSVRRHLRRLSSRSEIKRGLAAEALGRLKSRQAVPALIELLDDPDDGVRFDAVKALGEIGDPRALEPLIARLDSPNENFRRSVAEKLGMLGGARAVEALIRTLGDSADSVRLRAAQALARLGEPQWETWVEGSVSDLWNLGESGDARALEPLLKALADPEGDRSDAAKGLGELRDARAFEPLLGALKDENAYLRGAAAYALGQLGDKRALDPLLGVLADPDPYARENAAMGLRELGDPRACQPLIDALQDPERAVRGLAAQALGYLADRRAALPLTSVLEDADDFVRINAVEALARLGADEAAVEPLIRMLEDSNPRVPGPAAECLGAIGDSKAVGPLVKVFEAEVNDWYLHGHGGFALAGAFDSDGQVSDSCVCAAAAQALGRIADPQAADSLIRHLAVPWADLRKVLARALDDLGEPEWRQWVRGDVEDLARLGGADDRRAVQPLVLALEAPLRSHRQQAAKALVERARAAPASLEETWAKVADLVKAPHNDSHTDLSGNSSDCTHSDHTDTGIGLDFPQDPPDTDF